MPLLEQDRQKLDGIVSKMESDGESPDAIDFVVNDFKQKYDAQDINKSAVAYQGKVLYGAPESVSAFKALPKPNPDDLGLEEIQPDTALGSFFRGAGANTASGVGGFLGAATGAAVAGPESGLTLSIPAGVAGAGIGSALAESAFKGVMGEPAMDRLHAQMEANRLAGHEFAQGTGEALPALLPAAEGGGAINRLVTGGAKTAEEAQALWNAANPLTRAAVNVGESATSGLRMGIAGEAQRQVDQGTLDPGAMVSKPIEDAIKFGPVGLIPHAKTILGSIAKGIPDAAVMTLSSQLYDNIVKGKPLSLEGYKTETGEQIPSFLLLNAITSALHGGHVAPTGQSVGAAETPAPTPAVEPTGPLGGAGVDERIAAIQKQAADYRAAIESAPPIVKAAVDGNLEAGNTATAAALAHTATQLSQEQPPQVSPVVSPAAVEGDQLPGGVMPNAGAGSAASPLDEAQGTAEASPAEGAPASDSKNSIPAIQEDHQKTVESIAKQWAPAFNGGLELSDRLGGSGIAVEGDKLVVDPAKIASGLADGRWTPESVRAAMTEEVTHVGVDDATKGMIAAETGVPHEQVTQEQVSDRHASDWRALPPRVQQESERLYRVAAIEKARRAQGADALTEDQINQVLAGIPSSDSVRGAEFKRQVMQDRIWGVLTEEAQQRPEFHAWLKDFISKLIASIKNITAKLTDPETLRRLDDLEQRLRAKLAELGIGEHGAPIEAEQTTDELSGLPLSPPDENGWRQDFVAKKGDYKISVNDANDATSAAVWLGDKKVGELTTLSPHSNATHAPDGWLGIHKAWIDRGHRGKGLGTEMYRALASHLGEGHEGLYAQPLADAGNDTSRHNDAEIPAIYKKLGGRFDDEGNGYLPKLEKAISVNPNSRAPLLSSEPVDVEDESGKLSAHEAPSLHHGGERSAEEEPSVSGAGTERGGPEIAGERREGGVLAMGQDTFRRQVLESVIPAAAKEHGVPISLTGRGDEPRFALKSTGQIKEGEKPFTLLIPADMGARLLAMDPKDREAWVKNLHAKMEAMEAIHRAWRQTSSASFPRFIAGIYRDAREGKATKEDALNLAKEAHRLGVLGEVGEGTAKSKRVVPYWREVRAERDPSILKPVKGEGAGDLILKELQGKPTNEILARLDELTTNSDAKGAPTIQKRLADMRDKARGSDTFLRSLLRNMKGVEGMSEGSLNSHLGTLTKEVGKTGPMAESQWGHDAVVHAISSKNPADEAVLYRARRGDLGSRMKLIADSLDRTAKRTEGSRFRAGVSELKQAEGNLLKAGMIARSGTLEAEIARHQRRMTRINELADQYRQQLREKYDHVAWDILEDEVQKIVREKEANSLAQIGTHPEYVSPKEPQVQHAPEPVAITPEQDAEYLKAVESGDAETAQRMVYETAKKAGYNVGPVYHGTPTGGFDVFREGPTYFSHEKSGADVYQNPTASSIRGTGTPEVLTPETKAVYLKAKNVFDTRNPKDRQAFQHEFFGKGGEEWQSNATPLSERGLPDWTDGRDLVDWINEEKKPYDAIALDEGALPQTDGSVKPRGASIVVWNPHQIKSADPITRDAQGNVIPLSQRFNPESNDIRYSSDPVPPEDHKVPDDRQYIQKATEKHGAEAVQKNWNELRTISDRLMRRSEEVEKEGLSPTAATEQERTYKAGGDVNQYRKSFPKAELEGMASRAVELSRWFYDGNDRDFGRKLLRYVSKGGYALPGMRDNLFARAWTGISLINDPKVAARYGIDPEEMKRPTSEVATQAGTALGAFSKTIYNPLEKVEKEIRSTEDAKLKSVGITDPVTMAQDIQKDVEAKQREIAKALPPEVKHGIIDDTLASDWFENALPAFDEKKRGMLTRLKAILQGISEWRAKLEELEGRESKSAPTPVAPAGAEGEPEKKAASRPEAGKAYSKEEIQQQLDALVNEAHGILSDFFGVKKSRAKKVRPQDAAEKIRKAVEKIDTAAAAEVQTFRDWVNGAKQKGISDFDDLMEQNVNAGGFDREAFERSLTDKFKDVDPDFIKGVADRIEGLMNAREGDETAKVPDFDGRAKRIVGSAIAQDSSADFTKTRDPMTEAVKDRMKELITPSQFDERLARLGIEETTRFAMSRKVEADIARRKAEALQRKSESEQKREAEAGERQAASEIDLLATQLDGNDPQKKPGSDFRKLVDDFKKLKMDEAGLRAGLSKLNVNDRTADKLVQLLQLNRQRQMIHQWTFIRQNVQKAREAAIERAVKAMEKPKLQEAPKRSKFVRSLLDALNAGVLDSPKVREAFSSAYELHGLTTPRIEALATTLRDIDALPDGIVKQTMLGRANDLVNELAPAQKSMDYLADVVQGVVLSRMSTMLMQGSNLLIAADPMSSALELFHRLPMSKTEMLKNGSTFGKIYAQYLKEIADARKQGYAGLQGTLGGESYGLGVSPSGLANFRVGQQRIGPLKPSELYKMRIGRRGPLAALLGSVPESAAGKTAKNAALLPAWWASKSFNAIRGAEAVSGQVDKNMDFRFFAMEHFMNKGMDVQQAWNKVSDLMNPRTNKEMWDAARKQAQSEMDKDLISNHQLDARATELVQDQIDKEHDLRLLNRHRELSAWRNFKSPPLTTIGDAYAKATDWLKDKTGFLKMILFFQHFGVNIAERTVFHTPLLGLIGTSKAAAEARQVNPTQIDQRKINIFGSMEGYRQARLAMHAVGVVHSAVAVTLGALAYAFWKSQGDKTKPPTFWITGGLPQTEPFGKQRQMEMNGWYKPSTLYLRVPGTDKTVSINYVQAFPALAMPLSMIGNFADRVMFPELLNYKTDARTGARDFDYWNAAGQPVASSVLAPATRSTFVTFEKTLTDFISDPEKGIKGFAKLGTRPIGDAAFGMTLGGMGSRDVEKALQPEVPRQAKTAAQSAMSGIPFAAALGADTGVPMINQAGDPVSPFPYLPFFSNPQQGSPETKKAAQTLNDLGIYKDPMQEWSVSSNTVEIAHDGKRYILNFAERADLMKDIGTRFAAKVNDHADKLEALSKKDFKKMHEEVDKYLSESRDAAIRRFSANKVKRS